MVVRLESSVLSIIVKPFGAELVSVRSIEDGEEFMWCGEPAVWPRHAPILFPFVGRLNGNEFRHDGQTYEMGQHGFARDLPFEVIESSGRRAVLELRDSERTRACYPFAFIFRVIFELRSNTLTTTYRVTNPGPATMFFSVGAHPGFACKGDDGASLRDYYLQFEKTETTSRWLVQDGLLTSTGAPFLEGQDVLDLSPTLFSDDALVFKELASRKVSLCSRKSSRKITVGFPGFPYLGVWAKPANGEFVCIEPWCGLADTVGFAGTLSEKEGIQCLEVSATFECKHTVTFER